jgi:NTP pyrophosphatase (non-canonical NTP hydrolase)
MFYPNDDFKPLDGIKKDANFDDIYSRQLIFENMLIKSINQKKPGSLPNKQLSEFDEEEKASFSKELAFLLNKEVSEFIDAVGNFKLHKSQKDGKSQKEIKDEIADIFIFTLNTALTYNMTPQELLDEVEKKQNKNFDRQKNNY